MHNSGGKPSVDFLHDAQAMMSTSPQFQVSLALATAAKGVDLVVLEGMGRAIETNLNAELSCDKLNLGMIKHPEVRHIFQNLVLSSFQALSNVVLNMPSAYAKGIYLGAAIFPRNEGPGRLKHLE